MSRRTTRVCARPGCPELTSTSHCAQHTPKAWATSSRRTRLGKSGWQQQRDATRTLRRHARICHWCGQPGADQVDHVVALAHGGTDTDDNRRPIHARPCHAEKTQAEAQRSISRHPRG